MPLEVALALFSIGAIVLAGFWCLLNLRLMPIEVAAESTRREYKADLEATRRELLEKMDVLVGKMDLLLECLGRKR